MLKKLVATIVGAGIMFGCSVAAVMAADYAHEVKSKNMTFSWSLDGDNLAVKMAAKTTGWVGVGFNPTKKMKDANFILGYVKKGKAKIVDEFGTGDTKHRSDKKLDGTMDATLVAGSEDGGVTTIEFTMPLNSADVNDGKIDVNGDTIVLLGYGAGRDSFKSKHKYRATLKVNLTTGSSEEI